MSFNKVLFFISVLLIYLGLSKSLAPSEFGISYVFNEESLSELIQGAPVSVVLLDTHATGFIIKTHYHKYKIIHGFQTYEEVIARTSRTFSQRHANHIGMSVFRRTEDLQESFTPLPPGSVFIGDKTFGRWAEDPRRGRVWRFYRAYRYLPQSLGIDGFPVTYTFYQELLKRERGNEAFFGFNDEFGTNGSLTRKAFPDHFEKEPKKQLDLKEYMRTYFKENF